MVKISPLIASILIGFAAALPQQAASGTESFSLPAPTGTGLPLPSGTGGFGGHGGPGGHGHPSGTGGFGPAPTGAFGGAKGQIASGFPSGTGAPTGGFGGHGYGGHHSGGPVPTGGFGQQSGASVPTGGFGQQGGAPPQPTNAALKVRQGAQQSGGFSDHGAEPSGKPTGGFDGFGNGHKPSGFHTLPSGTGFPGLAPTGAPKNQESRQ